MFLKPAHAVIFWGNPAGLHLLQSEKFYNTDSKLIKASQAKQEPDITVSHLLLSIYLQSCFLIQVQDTLFEVVHLT